MRPTLVLIHGFPHDHTLWQDNIAPLSTAAEVIAIDLLGFGAPTDVPEVISMEAYAQQLHDRLQAAGVQRAVLCGLSMGGYVALAFLERWPQLVAGLILCNTRSTADTEEAQAARLATAHDALTKGSAVIARSMLPKVLAEHTRTNNPSVAARISSMMAAQDPRAIAAASRGMRLRPDRTQVLRDTQIPVLIITGTADALMPLPTSQAMAHAAPNAELIVLPNAGHLSNVDAPEAFNSAVLAFIQANAHAWS